MYFIIVLTSRHSRSYIQFTSLNIKSSFYLCFTDLEAGRPNTSESKKSSRMTRYVPIHDFFSIPSCDPSVLLLFTSFSFITLISLLYKHNVLPTGIRRGLSVERRRQALARDPLGHAHAAHLLARVARQHRAVARAAGPRAAARPPRHAPRRAPLRAAALRRPYLLVTGTPSSPDVTRLAYVLQDSRRNYIKISLTV